MTKYLCIGVIAGFIAGIAIGIPYGKDQVNQTVFNAGYDSAMHHVRTTIGKRMAEATPFYISDLGIRFTPRNTSITSIKFIGENSSKLIAHSKSGSSPLSATSYQLSARTAGALCK